MGSGETKNLYLPSLDPLYLFKTYLLEPNDPRLNKLKAYPTNSNAHYYAQTQETVSCSLLRHHHHHHHHHLYLGTFQDISHPNRDMVASARWEIGDPH
jgi:hypothetical protein